MTTDRELKPGDRVLVEAEVSYNEDTNRVILLTLGTGDRPFSLDELFAGQVLWHHDDRAELAAELERVKAERDFARKAVDTVTATALKFAAERDQLRAQVAAMRPVVEAAEAWRDTDPEETELEANIAELELIHAVDAYRASQTAPPEAPESLRADEEGTVVAQGAKPSTGTTEGRTAGEAFCAHCGCHEENIGGPSCLGTNDCPTVRTLVEPEPRTWRAGDPEPGPEVTAVVQNDFVMGDVRWWPRNGFWHNHEPEPHEAENRCGDTWKGLLRWGSLTDASTEEQG